MSTSVLIRRRYLIGVSFGEFMRLANSLLGLARIYQSDIHAEVFLGGYKHPEPLETGQKNLVRRNYTLEDFSKALWCDFQNVSLTIGKPEGPIHLSLETPTRRFPPVAMDISCSRNIEDLISEVRVYAKDPMLLVFVREFALY